MSTMPSLHIRGGRVIDPANRIDETRDLFVQDGIIVNDPPSNPDVINARGLIVSPGLIDIHVHLREPGQSHKETIATGTRAAAAGGFTSVVCMPNTTPPIDTPETVAWVQKKAAETACVHVFSTAALTRGLAGLEVAPLEALAAQGAVAFTDDGHCVQNLKVMREAVQRAHALGIPIMDHCQEATLTQGSILHEGSWSQRLGLHGWPRLAEEVIVARNILLAQESNHPIHCQHISSRESVHLLREARARGIPISGEASPHHITFTDQELQHGDTNFKVNPPLRTQEDCEAIIAGIADGTITILASDHAPHSPKEKGLPIDQASFGMLGLETELAVFLTLLFHQRKTVTLSQLIAMLTVNPAQLLHLDRGRLSVGKTADITLIDPNFSWTYDKETSYSLSRNTPFHGHRFQGRAVRTIVAGKTVWECPLTRTDRKIVDGR
ncbi:MAG: dihydroorotase [Chthoniobacterales bacterium]|nr:dihydroorotase [Chthoniobacterales bacterium]